MSKDKKKGIEERVKAWLWRQKGNIKRWLYNRVALAVAGFLGLNMVDGYVSNHALSLARQLGVAQTIEANPFLYPILGNWTMGVKGLLGLAVIGLVARLRNLSPTKVFYVLMFGCIALAVAISWNLWAIFR
jgi:hypothetical protein